MLAIFVVISLVNAQIRPIISTRDRDAVILKQVYDLNPDGSYVYSYETSNGIAADQQGYLKNRGSQLEAQVRIFFIADLFVHSLHTWPLIHLGQRIDYAFSANWICSINIRDRVYLFIILCAN